MSEQKGLRLNQVIALEKGIKSRTEKDLTAAHHGLKKTELLNGFDKTYKPKDEDGERRPPETKIVQVKVEEVISQTLKLLVDSFDITAQKDYANCSAKADVVVDGKVLVAEAPVTYLLWLEKQLVNLHTFVRELPTLSTAEHWIWDSKNTMFSTPSEFQNSTKKVQRPLVLVPATEKHPAQVQLVTEDVHVGELHTTKHSGCIPDSRRREMLDRVEKLQRAVKLAREQANMIDAPKKEFGLAVMNFLFSK